MVLVVVERGQSQHCSEWFETKRTLRAVTSSETSSNVRDEIVSTIGAILGEVGVAGG
jgi:hypothetical protein